MKLLPAAPFIFKTLRALLPRDSTTETRHMVYHGPSAASKALSVPHDEPSSLSLVEMGEFSPSGLPSLTLDYSLVLPRDDARWEGSSTLQVEHCLLGDHFKIAQILRNLVSNALKFSPKEKPITVRGKLSFSPLDCVLLAVVDCIVSYNSDVATGRSA